MKPSKILNMLQKYIHTPTEIHKRAGWDVFLQETILYGNEKNNTFTKTIRIIIILALHRNFLHQ